MNRALNVPSAFRDPVLQILVRDSECVGNLREAHLLSADNESGVAARVSTLLSWCGPPAVPYFIVAIIVWVAVNTVLGGWAFTHVLKEVFKLQPTLANRDSSIHVIMCDAALRISGARLHICPATIRSRKPLAVGLEADLVHCSCPFFANAATRFSSPFSTLKACDITRHRFSAVTHALSFIRPSASGDYRDDNETPDSRSKFDFYGRIRDSIFRLIHRCNMFGFSERRSASTDGVCAFIAGDTAPCQYSFQIGV